MLPPGFEPGSSPREGEMIDRTTLQERSSKVKRTLFKSYVCYFAKLSSYFSDEIKYIRTSVPHPPHDAPAFCEDYMHHDSGRTPMLHFSTESEELHN